ncbi:MAG: amidohydrolase [Chloroflexota bacterium]|nr:amidohydrolase [Chloroflexota bacterium]
MPSAAELVLTGGAVHTVDAGRSRARAVAIRGGRIAAVGDEQEIATHVGPRTRVVQLRGRMVVPGFQDAHIHPIGGGLNSMRCDLHGARGRDEYLALVEAYACANPDVPWILGDGWSMDDFPGGTPRREDLDAIVPDRPVLLPNRDGHGAWANSRALAVAGIDRTTADPSDGRIERDADGDPTGMLQEGAVDLVERHAPPATPEELEEALRRAQAQLHSLGITAWQDAIVHDEEFAAYAALAGRGELTARVVGALWWDRARGEEQIEELIERRARGPIGRFAATSVKIMQDGILENFTGAMIDSYLDRGGNSTGNRGLSFVDPARLGGYVTRLDGEGFQVHFHAIGDRAVREALDAIEVARKANGPTDGRHHIAHIQVIHPADVPRFARLDVVANAQPYWACLEGQMENLTIPFLGPERTTWQYPFRSLLRAGAKLAMGSDWSVSTPNPLLEMEVAVTRVQNEHRGRKAPFLPNEALDLADALAAFTMGSAYVNHLDAETGSIEPGKLADIAVLDRDLFAAGAGPIGEAKVVLTLVEGVAVYEDADLER